MGRGGHKKGGVEVRHSSAVLSCKPSSCSRPLARGSAHLVQALHLAMPASTTAHVLPSSRELPTKHGHAASQAHLVGAARVEQAVGAHRQAMHALATVGVGPAEGWRAEWQALGKHTRQGQAAHLRGVWQDLLLLNLPVPALIELQHVSQTNRLQATPRPPVNHNVQALGIPCLECTIVRHCRAEAGAAQR